MAAATQTTGVRREHQTDHDAGEIAAEQVHRQR